MIHSTLTSPISKTDLTNELKLISSIALRNSYDLKLTSKLIFRNEGQIVQQLIDLHIKHSNDYFRYVSLVWNHKRQIINFLTKHGIFLITIQTVNSYFNC